MRRSGRLLAWLLLPLALSACSPEARLSAEERAVRTTIDRYDSLLAEGYRSMNMNAMREVASRLQAETEYIHMSSLAEGGIRLDPELRRLEFVRVSLEATSAQAETRETWDYRHYSRATGALVLEQKGLVYVTDVRAISTTATVEPTVLGTITPVLPQP
jgi:hypothetical protein